MAGARVLRAGFILLAASGFLLLILVRPEAALIVISVISFGGLVLTLITRHRPRRRSRRRVRAWVGVIVSFVLLLAVVAVWSPVYYMVAEPIPINLNVSGLISDDQLHMEEQLVFVHPDALSAECARFACVTEEELRSAGWTPSPDFQVWSRSTIHPLNSDGLWPARRVVEIPLAASAGPGFEVEDGDLTLEVPQHTLLAAYPAIAQRMPVPGTDTEVVTSELSVLASAVTQTDLRLELASGPWRGAIRNRVVQVTANDAFAWVLAFLSSAIIATSQDWVRDWFRKVLRRRPSTDAQGQPVPPAVHPILALAANPVDLDTLRLGREFREIEARIRMSPNENLFVVEDEHAVRPRDVPELLLRHRPSIVHFSGHGSAGGNLFFESNDGLSREVAIGALASTLEALPGVRCLVLNACYSAGLAALLAPHVDCVVGTTGAIQDDSAAGFAAGFYGALAYGKSIQTAYELGKAEINLEGLGDEDLPVLVVREGVDANRIQFVNPR